MHGSIVTDHLTKRYSHEKVAALDAITFRIESGEIYGFLGANGAGKSTTIRLLMNFLRPSSGSAQIMGLDSVKQSTAIKKHVGYLSGDVALYLKPTGREVLDYMSSLQPTSLSYRTKLEKRFEAEVHKPINTLSKGNRQKIGIIQAFMHEPAVLILDEPTSGLDPLMQEAFYETLLEAKARGAAILMSSHNLTEAQRMCDRIGIIKQGKLIHEQSTSEDTSLSTPLYTVTFANKNELLRSKTAKGIERVSLVDSQTAVFKPSHSIGEALAALGQFNITAFSTQTPDLEDEFLEYYGDKP